MRVNYLYLLYLGLLTIYDKFWLIAEFPIYPSAYIGGDFTNPVW